MTQACRYEPKIQRTYEADRNGFGVIETFCGHGIGAALHMQPQVACVGRPGTGMKLKEGMVLYIMAMFAEHSPELDILDDGWTAVTRDRGCVRPRPGWSRSVRRDQSCCPRGSALTHRWSGRDSRGRARERRHVRVTQKRPKSRALDPGMLGYSVAPDAEDRCSISTLVCSRPPSIVVLFTSSPKALTITSMSNSSHTVQLDRSAWDAGLIWGGIVLVVALGLLALLIPDIREATREVPTLSPDTIGASELDDFDPTLVEVSGFEPDCSSGHLDNKQVLFIAEAANGGDSIVVALPHNSECPKLGASFRADARVRNWWDTEIVASEFVIVEPRRFPTWALVTVSVIAGIGLAGIASAFAKRKRLIDNQRLLASRGSEPTPPAMADPGVGEVQGAAQGNADPYRPQQSDRLIVERLAPAAAHLDKLRRRRIVGTVLRLLLVATTVTGTLVIGLQVRERERTWLDGSEALEAEVVGKSERVGLGIVHTELEVSYVDDDGHGHRERVSATSLGKRPDTTTSARVRYRPEQPELFAVSWIHEQYSDSMKLLWLVSTSLLVGGLISLIKTWRDCSVQQVLAVFDDPREALLDLLGVEHPDGTGQTLTYHFRVRDSTRGCSVVVRSGQPGPLFLDRRGTVALALYSPKERSGLLVLSEDLRELESPPFSAEQLRDRYRAKHGGATPSKAPPRRKRTRPRGPGSRRRGRAR